MAQHFNALAQHGYSGPAMVSRAVWYLDMALLECGAGGSLQPLGEQDTARGCQSKR